MELCVNFNASKNVCCEISGGNVTVSISLLEIFKLERGFPKCQILTNSMQLLHLCHHTFRLYQWIEESSQANIQSLALYHHFSSSKPVLPTFDPILPTFSSFLAIFGHFQPFLTYISPFWPVFHFAKTPQHRFRLNLYLLEFTYAYFFIFDHFWPFLTVFSLFQPFLTSFSPFRPYFCPF